MMQVLPRLESNVQRIPLDLEIMPTSKKNKNLLVEPSLKTDQKLGEFSIPAIRRPPLKEKEPVKKQNT